MAGEKASYDGNGLLTLVPAADVVAGVQGGHGGDGRGVRSKGDDEQEGLHGGRLHVESVSE